MTEDQIIDTVISEWQDIIPRYHYGNHQLVRPQAVQKANRLFANAERVALTNSHPAWSIYNQFTAGMTDAEVRNHRETRL